MTRTKEPTRPHSIRCADSIWAAAKERADREGIYLNSVLTELLDAYGAGAIDVETITLVKEDS